MRYLPLALALLLLPATAHAAGFAHNQNFLVFTPGDSSTHGGQALAEQVLAKADQYRREVAMQWLGEELPPSIGRTVINVHLSDAEDRGITWAKGQKDRKFHNLYLSTSYERAVGSTLAHEIVHVVLATQFPDQRRLPAWVEEGIASRYDDPARVQTRQKLLEWCGRSNNWPALESVLTAQNISAEDQASYAAAASLTEFLLQQAGRDTLLAFAASGAGGQWSAALEQHYGLPSLEALQQAWQAWAQTPSVAHSTIKSRKAS